MSKPAMKFIDAKLAHIDRRSLSASQENVIRAVAWKTFEDGPCQCGVDVLAIKAKANERTVRRALEKAEDKLGLIRCEPTCRGAHGGRGRLFDKIYIVGFNDIGGTSETPKSENQPDHLSSWSVSGPNGRAVTNNRTDCRDQPDKKSGAYIENQLAIKRQSTSHPYPSHTFSKVRRRVREKLTNEVEEVIAAVAIDLPDTKHRAVLEAFLAPLIRQRQFTAPSLEGGIRALIAWLVNQGLGEDELRKALSQLLESRIATVKPSDIERAVKTLIAHRPLPRKLPGDAALMRDWPAVLSELEKLIGADITQQIFSSFALDRIDTTNLAGRTVARVSTHADWAKRHVEANLSSQFRAAMNAVFPGVSDIWIETRKAAT